MLFQLLSRDYIIYCSAALDFWINSNYYFFNGLTLLDNVFIVCIFDLLKGV